MADLVFDTTVLELEQRAKAAEELAENRRLALHSLASDTLKVVAYAKALEEALADASRNTERLNNSFWARLVFLFTGSKGTRYVLHRTR